MTDTCVCCGLRRAMDGAMYCSTCAKEAEQSAGWISVNERLPRPMMSVLCWYEYFRFGEYNRMYQTYGIGYYFRDGHWGGEVSNGQRARVLYWKPLPEPPKGY
jgi:predicted amidophosphoribosyltransferase